jgi:hypothetical protein
MSEQIMWTFPKHILNKKKIKTAVKTLWERTTWQKLNNEKTGSQISKEELRDEIQNMRKSFANITTIKK